MCLKELSHMTVGPGKSKACRAAAGRNLQQELTLQP